MRRLIARNGGGTFILRIEDTDQGRLVEGATDVIYRTMAECGLTHDEGPDVGGPVAPYIQSERVAEDGVVEGGGAALGDPLADDIGLTGVHPGLGLLRGQGPHRLHACWKPAHRPVHLAHRPQWRRHLHPAH